jgi:hypothetical protein
MLKEYGITSTINLIPCISSSFIEDTTLRNRIFGDNNISSNNFFIIMNKIFPPISYLENWNECLNNLLSEIKKLIKENNPNDVELDILSNIFCFLNSEKLNRKIESSNEHSRRTFFTKILNVFKQIFQQYFIIDKSTCKKIIDNRNFVVGEHTFNSHIYSIEISYTFIPGKIYILYYMVVTGGIISSTNVIKTIIHIIPKKIGNTDIDNHITVYGLDKKYVVAGCFINKIFDYKPQAPITRLTGHLEHETRNYRFIGDLINYDFLPIC